jgi:hypothetical protein
MPNKSTAGSGMSPNRSAGAVVCGGSSASILLRAIAAYSGFSSSRIALRRWRWATRPVVPAPPNGSSTTPPSGQPARMHGSIRSGGILGRLLQPHLPVAAIVTQAKIRRRRDAAVHALVGHFPEQGAAVSGSDVNGHLSSFGKVSAKGKAPIRALGATGAGRLATGPVRHHRHGRRCRERSPAA